jgi:hypothetical protein
MSADEGSRRSVGIAAMGAVLVGCGVYIADSGPLWPGLALLSVLAAALAGGLLARRPRDVLALGTGAFAGVWLASVARALEPGSPGDAALLGLVPAAFFGALVLAAGYAVFALLLPVRGRARRLAAAAVLGAGLVLAWVALLSGTSAAPVQSYRVVDPQTIVVVVGGAPHGWTRVSGVAESASTVAVSAQTTTWLPGPGTANLELVELTVRLAQPLNGRAVTDGTGQAVPLVGGP